MAEERLGRGEPLGDMPLEELEPAVREVADWIARYLTGVSDYPVLSRLKPGEILHRLPQEMPESGEGFSRMLRDLHRYRASIAARCGTDHGRRSKYHG